MNHKKKTKIRQITLMASADEIRRIELIMHDRKRSNYSDTMRILIIEESEKILNKTIAGKINNTESAI